MINNIHTMGLIVNSISPLHNSINVNVNSPIKIEFNAYINNITLMNSIFLIEDKDNNFKSFKDRGTSEIIDVRLSNNKNGTVTLTPNLPLNANTRYIVVVTEKVESTMGDKLKAEYSSSFHTEVVGTYPPVTILNDFGVVSEKPPVIKWVSQLSGGYRVQVSPEQTFENLVIEKYIDKCIADEEIKCDISDYQLDEGLYFYRVKSASGTWSEVFQFFIKLRKLEDGLLSQSDEHEGILFYEDDTLELVLLESFPTDQACNVSCKINIIYFVYEGKVNESRFDFSDSYIEGELFDSEDEELISEHGIIDGKWVVVYDNAKDVTYVIFCLDNLGGGI